MMTGFEKWAEQMITGLAGLAEQQGSAYLGAGLKLCSAKEWGKGTTGNGKPAEFTVPFIIEDEHEHMAFECADISAIIDCLNLLYTDFPESEKRGQGAKVIPFAAGGSA